MGFWNPRTICPSCGGKIHTQSFGAERWTGSSCQLCGTPLTGRVIGGRAQLRTPGAPLEAGPAAPKRPYTTVEKISGALILLVLLFVGIGMLVHEIVGDDGGECAPQIEHRVVKDPDCPDYGDVRRP